MHYATIMSPQQLKGIAFQQSKWYGALGGCSRRCSLDVALAVPKHRHIVEVD